MNYTRSIKKKAFKQTCVSRWSPKQSSTGSVKQNVRSLSVPILSMSLHVCLLLHLPLCSNKMIH